MNRSEEEASEDVAKGFGSSNVLVGRGRTVARTSSKDN
jgi:hypothetical protein